MREVVKHEGCATVTTKVPDCQGQFDDKLVCLICGKPLHLHDVTEEQRRKARDMQLAINRYNKSRDDDHSRDEELDGLEIDNENS